MGSQQIKNFTVIKNIILTQQNYAYFETITISGEKSNVHSVDFKNIIETFRAILYYDF